MNTTFGKNLKRLRISKNLTQEQVSQMLNVSAKAVSRWECGTTMPDVMLLPRIAKLYCVTVDDLYKEKCIAYDNYAQRLMSVYEQTGRKEDFWNAENEFAKLLKDGKYTMKDLCHYAILYQFFMQDCKKKSLELFDKGLRMGCENDENTYHWIERQKMCLLSSVGEDETNIREYTEKFDKNSDNVYDYINLLAAYFFAGNNEKALGIFTEAEKKFENSSILYIFGGDVYKRLKMYDEAMACWDKSISIDVSFTAAFWSKADCFEEMGEYKKACTVWEELVKWYEEKGYEIEAEAPRRRLEECQKKTG
ncbi:MAG: helix-turn-helix domain-containing protein [Clostridia bacterium]|nr:helix-turn-helix domain-containing protein [Clostridia bacterium]